MTALYSLYDALVSINVPGDKARAVVGAMEMDMTAVLATKSDLALVRQELGGEITLLRQELGGEIALLRQELASSNAEMKTDIKRLEERLDHKLELQSSLLTIRLGSMLVVAIGVLYTVQRLGH